MRPEEDVESNEEMAAANVGNMGTQSATLLMWVTMNPNKTLKQITLK